MGGVSTAWEVEGDVPLAPDAKAAGDWEPVGDVPLAADPAPAPARSFTDRLVDYVRPAAEPTQPVSQPEVGPPAGPPMSIPGATLPVPQLPAHAAPPPMHPSPVGEAYDATKEVLSHPLETLVGADLPSQEADKQARIARSAAAGDKFAQGVQAAQETAQKPLLQPSATKTFQRILDPKSKNLLSRALTGGTKAVETLSSPDNLMLLSSIPFAPEDATQLISGVFGAQLAQGAGAEGYEALRAAHRGDYGEAAERGATALISAAMAAASAKHAAGAEPGKPVTAPQVSEPTPDATRTFTAPANAARMEEATVGPGGGEPATGEVKPPSKDLTALAGEATNQPQEVGETDKDTGRDILQPTDNPAHLDAAAQAAAPELEQRLTTAMDKVDGAKLEAVRPRKTSERLVQKLTQEGQPAETIPDYLASRVVVDTPAAHRGAVAAIKKQFPDAVVRDEDQFDEGDDDYGYRRHALQVQLSNGVTAEVHIVPKEVAEANPDEHENYKEAREAKIKGQTETFKKAAEEAKAKNGAAMAKFDERNGIVRDEKATNSEAKGGRGESPEPVAAEVARTSAAQPIAVGQTVELHGHPGVPDGTPARVTYWNDRGELTKGENGALALRGKGRVAIPREDGTERHVVNVREHEIRQVPAQQSNAPWIGVDLDGTLAHYDGFKGPTEIGKPVPEMVDRVKGWLAEGKQVRIFTARAGDPAAVTAIEAWSEKNLGQKLPVTNVKDDKMTQLWDDRAVQVGRNTGTPLGDPGEAANERQGERNVIPKREVSPEGLAVEAGRDAKAALRERAAKASDAGSEGIERGDSKAVSDAASELNRIARGLGRLRDGGDGDGSPVRASVGDGRNDRPTATQEGARTPQKPQQAGQSPREPGTPTEQRALEATFRSTAEAGGSEKGPSRSADSAGEVVQKVRVLREVRNDAGAVRLGGDVRELLHEGGAGEAQTEVRLDRLDTSPPKTSKSSKPTAAELAADLRARGNEVDTGAGLKERSRGKKEVAGQIEAARNHSLAENAKLAKTELVDSPAAQYLKLDADALFAVGRAYDGDTDWIAVTLPSDVAEDYIAKLRRGDENLVRLADAMERARLESGTLVLHGPESDAQTVREEAFHAWQVDHDLQDEVVKALMKQPLVQRIGEKLRKRGYAGDDQTIAAEATAKAAIGDRDIVSPADAKALNDIYGRILKENGVEGRPEDGGETSGTPARAGAAGKGLHKLQEPQGRPGGPGDEGGGGGVAGRGEAAVPGSKDGRALYQRRELDTDDKSGPVWYLKSEKLIDEKMRGPMTGDQVLRMLENGGIKADELKWTTLPEFLKGKFRVTPEQVKQHLAEGGIQIEEVTKEASKLKPGDANETLSWALAPGGGGKTRYGDYQLPGGENYREMLLTLPDKPLAVPPHGRIEELPNGKFRVDAPGLQAQLFDTRAAAEAETRRMGEIFERPKAIAGDKANFRGPHWDEPNVLAHVRINDRLTPDGKKLLHIEEIQSDWHQKGRGEGYRDDSDSSLAAVRARLAEINERLDVIRDMPAARGGVGAEEQRLWTERRPLEAQIRAKDGGVPDAPFKKDWQEMAFRRMVRLAAENGYDGVSWTPGEKQAERYDLNKHIDKLHWSHYEKGIEEPEGYSLVGFKGGKGVFNQYIPATKLEDTIGKDIATKIRAGEGRIAPNQVGASNPYRALSGVDLKVGGEGMKGFYDKIIPDYARKFGKQWGAKVGEVEIGQGTEPKSARAMDAYLREHFDTDWANSTAAQRVEALEKSQTGGGIRPTITAPYLPITPEMRKDVVKHGVQLFQRRPPEDEEHNTPVPLNELIDASIDMKTRKLSLAERVKKSGENSAKHIADDASGAIKALAKAKGELAGLWGAYRRPPVWTDFKDILGQFQGAMQAEHWRLSVFADELKRVVPDKARRVAMTNWVEANGDKRVLQDRARASKTDDLRKGYELAQNLTPEETRIARAGKEYFRQMLEAGKNASLLEQGVVDYIMHIHEPDSKTADAIRSLVNFSELNPNPSIIKQRVFRSYFDAEQAGEKAKDKDFGFLVAAYQDTFARAIQSRGFIRSLLEGRAKDGRPLATIGGKGKWAQLDPADEPYVLTQPSRPEKLAHSILDYRYLDHPALRNWLWELTDKDAEELNPKLFDDVKKALAIRGDLMLHPEIYDHVKNVLSRSAVRKYLAGRIALDVSNTLKQSLLSFSGFHQTQETVHGLEHLVNPTKLIDLNLADKKQRALVDHGLMVADFDGQQAMSEGVSTSTLKYVPVIGDFMARYQTYLFHDYIPRMKMTMAMHALDRNRMRFKAKLSDDQILEMTAKQSNAAFGGQNYKMIGRNPTFQDAIRLLALAPDFLESRAKFVGQAFTPFGKEQRVALVRGALVMYAGARILNYILNDGDAKWDKADAFSIVVKGKRYGLRTVQGDLLNLIRDPILFASHRLNPMTTRPLLELLSHRDEFGRQKSLTSQAKDFAKGAVPIPFQSRMKTAEADWAQVILNALGGEISKYRTPAEDLAHKLHLGNIPDKPDDQDAEKAEESRTKYQFVEDLRSGKKTTTDLWNAVGEGKLSAGQAKRAMEEAERTPLENDVSSLGLEDALKVYEKANAAERAEMEPILQAKRERWYKNPDVTPKEREKLESKLEEILDVP